MESTFGALDLWEDVCIGPVIKSYTPETILVLDTGSYDTTAYTHKTAIALRHTHSQKVIKG
jgi:hypothetical protein